VGEEGRINRGWGSGFTIGSHKLCCEFIESGVKM